MATRHTPQPDCRSFDETVRAAGLPALRRRPVATLQVNVGKLCNQACLHCHVEAGPQRSEVMGPEVLERLLWLLARSPGLTTVDITGGAPELNPGFRRLVEAARSRGLRVLDRCNLTVLLEPGLEDLIPFLARHEVGVVASLPCYGPKNVDAQRGKGVFERSIEALRRLNAAGYGQEGSGLTLDLVYNPLGPSLPPAQCALEADYKRELEGSFGVTFDHLLTLTNMPIARFRHSLERGGRLPDYEARLRQAFNPATVSSVMCLDLVSVSWRGELYDCDFNQMVALPLLSGDVGSPLTVWDLDNLDGLTGAPVATASHCFGCTAGAGSSCGGALTPT